MPAGRFVVAEQSLLPGAELELPPEIAHQARDVLRLGLGDPLKLLDGRGSEYPATVIELGRKRVVVTLGAREEAPREPGPRVVLCQGLLKAAKFETELQKCTELGVAEFVPLITERAVAAVRAEDELGEGKRRRWERILAEAVEQSGGSRLPKIAAPRSLSAALAELPPGGIALFPWEQAHDRSLRAALRRALSARGGPATVPELRLFIGPEGGFSPAEAELAERAGAHLVSLGPRILRAETAAIVAAALTLDELRAEG